MADLKIPSLNKRSNKYFFRKKLTLRRKSKRKLIKESFLMFSLSLLIIYLNYLIPNKKVIFVNFLQNLNKLVVSSLETFSYIYQIFLSLFILTSLIVVLILILGAVSRLFKVARRKTKQINFK